MSDQTVNWCENCLYSACPHGLPRNSDRCLGCSRNETTDWPNLRDNFEAIVKPAKPEYTCAGCKDEHQPSDRLCIHCRRNAVLDLFRPADDQPPEPKPSSICLNCVFHFGIFRQETGGQCKRNAPIARPGGDLPLWPRTNDESTCGEFRPRNEESAS